MHETKWNTRGVSKFVFVHRPTTLDSSIARPHKTLSKWICCFYNNVARRLYMAAIDKLSWTDVAPEHHSTSSKWNFSRVLTVVIFITSPKDLKEQCVFSGGRRPELVWCNMLLFFAVYVICKKKSLFRRVVVRFSFQSKIANCFCSKMNDSSRVRSTGFSSNRFGVQVSVLPKPFMIHP